MNTTLLIMAAGIGSRFGTGIKQLEPVDDANHALSYFHPWGVIFMYAFQLYKHRRKFRYFSDCVADSYEKVFGIILTICRIRHIIIIKRKEHSNVREHFI